MLQKSTFISFSEDSIIILRQTIRTISLTRITFPYPPFYTCLIPYFIYSISIFFDIWTPPFDTIDEFVPDVVDYWAESWTIRRSTISFNKSKKMIMSSLLSKTMSMKCYIILMKNPISVELLVCTFKSH